MSDACLWPKAPARRAPASLSTLPEDELAIAYLLHDSAPAFHELHRRVAPYLYAVAKRRVRSHDLAADLVQQAFLNAHLARERFQIGSSYRPWITRILVNLAVDQCRTARRRPVADIDVNELSSFVSDTLPAERSNDVARARRALERLRPRQRQVIEMHWLEERPFPEVARALGEQLSTVKVRAHRAYRELREALEQVG